MYSQRGDRQLFNYSRDILHANADGQIVLRHLPIDYRLILGVGGLGYADKYFALDTGTSTLTAELQSEYKTIEPLRVFAPRFPSI